MRRPGPWPARRAQPRDPVVAWARFAKRTRKEVIRVLTKTITIYPDMDGYGPTPG